MVQGTGGALRTKSCRGDSGGAAQLARVGRCIRAGPDAVDQKLRQGCQQWATSHTATCKFVGWQGQPGMQALCCQQALCQQPDLPTFVLIWLL